MKLYSRPGNDLTYRFTLIVESLARLRSRSCIIDGDVVLAACCGDAPRYAFSRTRSQHRMAARADHRVDNDCPTMTVAG